MINKLGVIVPYRNRYEQLDIFIKHIKNYLDKKNIRHEIIIVEQDDAKQFNRGMLLNIGYRYAKKMKCNYIVFHDVDMLPLDVDYSYSEKPIHLATDFILGYKENKREIFQEYFGGVTMFPIEIFEEINGYSNKYWGWGYEDTDLLLRCKVKGIDLDEISIKNTGKPKKALKFNGVDSYVKFRNIIDLDYDVSFFISFYPDDIICDHLKDSDQYTIFSIPGYDTSISFNSFSRYNFCTFDDDKNALYINSEIKTNYKTNICVTINGNVIRAYQDGIFIGETNITTKLLPYTDKTFAYLGVGEPSREGDERYFKGYLTNFAIFNKALDENEILELSNNETDDFRNDFGEYTSSKNLIIYFDSEHIYNYKLKDLVNNKITGKIVNCEIVDLTYEGNKVIKIPHRRKSLFTSLKHEENGFLGNTWKDKATRWNQLRFYNEISLNHHLINDDGLSNLEFIEHGKEYKNKITHVNVGI
jgi:hypothetical protein